MVRYDSDPARLAHFVDGVRAHASLTAEGVTWALELPAGRSAAARAVLTWDALRMKARRHYQHTRHPLAD